ncbi:hypothetical protein BRC91_11250 [Halobacteriales archaeon QS_4_62_28]|nr:MAG: hypothetical protein BRC91_11250 [Halobacteriales archaeon QS_4_62_28]
MEIPDLVRQTLGDEEITAGVNLGDEDAVCFTPTRTLVYRGEGLLSDEGVSEYPHDYERLAVSEGRRKTKFSLTYVDGKDSFTVPGKRTSAVLERLLEGNLRADDVIGSEEGVSDVFRFSELTLIVTDQHLLKHLGEHTWDGDFEVFAYDAVTSLHFEEGSVATAVVLEAGGHPERIKAPDDQAALFRKALEGSLFAYHDVDSLEELNRTIAQTGDEETDDEQADDRSDGLGLDSGIDPLVSDAETADENQTAEPPADGQRQTAGQRQSEATGSTDRDRSQSGSPQTTATAGDQEADIEAVEAQLVTLTETIEQQNELLAQQQQTIKQLIKELRQGR